MILLGLMRSNLIILIHLKLMVLVFSVCIATVKNSKIWWVALLVNTEFCKYVEALQGSKLDVLWFYLKKPLVNKTILCGVTYIAPEGSNNSNNECFQVTEQDFMQFTSENYTEICLFSDFNARSAP